MDLGGAHMPMTASIRLADIPGLQVNKSYSFDFFYCERKSSGSGMMNFFYYCILLMQRELVLQMSTSLDFYCDYYDNCDVCEGNGQSCCNITACNDSNACTIDSCPQMVLFLFFDHFFILLTFTYSIH